MVPAWAWVTVLVVVSAGLRLMLGLRDPSPWIFQDELLYSELAKSFAATGHFAVRETPGVGGFGFVYPALISPAWAPFRQGAGRVRRSQGDQRGPDVTLGHPGLSDRPPGGRHRTGACRDGARAGAAGDDLHEHDHDGERLLPGVPVLGVGAGAGARSADDRAPACRRRSHVPGVRHSQPGRGARAGAGDCDRPLRPPRGAGPTRADSSSGRLGAWRRLRPPG